LEQLRGTVANTEHLLVLAIAGQTAISRKVSVSVPNTAQAPFALLVIAAECSPVELHDGRSGKRVSCRVDHLSVQRVLRVQASSRQQYRTQS